MDYKDTRGNMRARGFIMVFFMTVLLAMSCDSQVSGSYEIVKAFPSLEFTRPVDIQHPGDGTNRLFVVEQRGVINVFDNSSNVATSSVFLDIEDRVNDGGNEEGLLGLAFHPDYENNGYFYVYYSADNPRRTVVSRYSVDATDAGTANRDSELVILEVGQPFGNHNGGQVSFGPDGYLYVGVGDGGSGGDPLGHGQNLSTLLGTILRIDVDSTVAGKNYAIPPDNPFAGNSDGYAEEIFAYGLRNPWRFSFDSETEQLWTGDVGQNDLEEIDIVESGKNYGWNIQEGGGCYEPSSGCDKTGLVQPIIDYGRRSGKSVTGGFVYRGSAVNDLQGYYIYADFVTGRIWALNASLDPVDNKELADTDLRISSFGVDASNELYIASFDGYIYQIRKKAN